MNAPALVVTTTRGAKAPEAARAAQIATRLGAPVVAHADADPTVIAYVVGRGRDELRGPDGARCFVQPGLLGVKLQQGAAHPFLRAVTADGSDVVDSVFDGTLGLAQDALHLACALSCAVRGVEHSPVLFSLLEEALPRLARDDGEVWQPGAARVSVEHKNAQAALAAAADDSVDVVSLDPMMSKPRKATPSFALLRDFAFAERATPALLAEALRVARRRVVLKLGKGAPLPAGAPAPVRVVPGAHVVYVVYEG